MELLKLDWKSPGPVSSRFMRETRFANILNGPIGSGKTRTVLMKALHLATLQKPSTRDGVRKFKLVAVQENYRQLHRATIPSIHKLLPRSAGEWQGAANAPSQFNLSFGLEDGTRVDFTMDLVAIGENAVEEVMRGYEMTCVWLIELDLLAREVYQFARGRVGRYPDMSEGGPSWYGIVGDCNAPEETSWLYQDIFRNTPDDVLLLRQPGGLEPNAENLANLPPEYYAIQMRDQPQWYIERMIRNRPGFSRDGKPVFPEYNETLHRAGRILEMVPGIPLRLGFDAGGSPAAVIVQKLANGKWRILKEIVSEQGTGPIRFGRMVAQVLHDEYPSATDIKGWADPSAAYGTDKQMGEASWIEIVASECGIRVDPAPTNAIIPRLEAVRRPLMQLIDGEPGFELSLACPVLNEGFNSGYRYRLMRVPGAPRFDESPDKNQFSHPMDALQYVLSAGGEDLEIRARHEKWEMATKGAQAEFEWEPFAD
jgi:hypothetical protein